MSNVLRRVAGWLRSTEEVEPGPEEVVRVELGSDIGWARVILARCQAEGLRVQLIDDELTAHHTTVGVRHALLVRGEELPAVREILARDQAGP